MNVIFSEIAYSALLIETQEKILTETGGVFLGYYENDNWYIVETIDPGPKSIFRQDYFEYDQPYVTHLINKRARLYTHNLYLLGLWHRHPGSFDIFSSTDDKTNAVYAQLRPEGSISILVNIDPSLRLSVFHVGIDPTGKPIYTKIQYKVGDSMIPAKYLELKKSNEIQVQIDHVGMKKIGLWYFMSRAVSHLNPFETLNTSIGREPNSEEQECANNSMNQTPEQVKDIIIENSIDDITFLSDEIGFNILSSWDNVTLNIYETTRNGSKKYVFSYLYLDNRNCCGIRFNDRIYLYEHNMFSTKRQSVPPITTLCSNPVSNTQYNTVLDNIPFTIVKKICLFTLKKLRIKISKQ